MNTPVWVAWLVVALMSVLSIVLLMGKGSFLIAGYNTSSKEEKQKYDVKKLCRVVGGGLSVLTLIIGIYVFYKSQLPNAISWLIPWGYLVTVSVIVILANTVCKAK